MINCIPKLINCIPKLTNYIPELINVIPKLSKLGKSGKHSPKALTSIGLSRLLCKKYNMDMALICALDQLRSNKLDPTFA